MVDARSAQGRWPWASAACLALAAVARLGFVLQRALDPDESQHLHAAWLVGQGRVPFVDFWEHHGPLLYYGLAPITRWLSDSPAIYPAARGLMVLLAGVALVLVYRVARHLGAPVAWATVLILAFHPQVIEHTTEVRPDVPALVAWLGALGALVTWRRRGGAGWLWGAGVAVGVAGAFTPKAIYGAAGLGLAAVLGTAGGPGAPKRVLSALARLAGGAGVPLVALLGCLWVTGGGPALDGFVEHVLARNLDFADYSKQLPVTGEGLGLLVLALGGIGLTVRRVGATVLRHPVHGSLLVPFVVVGVALTLPTTPAVYRQAWLPLLVIAGVYAGVALDELLTRAGAKPGLRAGVIAGLAVSVGVIGPAIGALTRALHDGNQAQLRTMRLELRHACPGEPVLDGTGLYVFRPAAYHYRVLINGIRYWIANGVIPEERIVEDVRRTAPAVLYADWRVRSLVGPMATFLREHYVPLPDGLWVAGASLRVDGGAGGGRAYVELLAAGPYYLAADPAITVAVDGRAVRPGLVRLHAGRHEVTWTGPAGRIRLAAATCLERRALAEIP